jgi:hypothetical protein
MCPFARYGAQWGSGDTVPLNLKLGMKSGVISQLHAPAALPPKKEHLINIEQEAV